jgi:hypothetical protein
MNNRSIELQGVPGTDAVASKRGYYYQDVVTALAWLRLKPSEILRVEDLEDFSVDDGTTVKVEQVRHVSASLTLVGAVEYLERVLDIASRNHGVDFSFAYRSTASIGKEKSRDHRISGQAGLEYWETVKNGGDPAPLIAVLKDLAPAGGRLSAFLAQKAPEDVVDGLISKVTWAANAPSSTPLEHALTEGLAALAQREVGGTWAEQRQLMPAVIATVQRASMQPDPENRRLTYGQLRDLLTNLTSKTIPNDVYDQLIRDSAIVRNPPIEAVNSDTERRLHALRLKRFFPESVPEDAARQLAGDVAHGGTNQIANKELRALALSWTARVLAEEDTDAARAMLKEAQSLAPQQHVTLVSALIHAQENSAEALRSIQDERGGTSMTIRYAIARKGEGGDGWPWVTEGTLAPPDFDADGSFLIIWDHLLRSRWQEALEWWEDVPEEALSTFPALLWAGAHAALAYGVPEPMRWIVLHGPPIADEMPLVDDPNGLKARRKAAVLFAQFHARANELGLNKTATTAHEYGLWLRLRDRVTQSAASTEVAQLWDNSGHDMRWIPLAILAGVQIDRPVLAQELDRRGKVYGSLTYEDARARLALMLSSHAKEWIDHWPSLREHFEPYFSAPFLQHCEIQGLIQSERLEEAAVALENASDLPDFVRTTLQLEIAPVDDEESLGSLRTAAAADTSPGSVHNLIKALVRAKKMEEATELAGSLFKQTRDHDHAEEWLRLLARQNEWDRIVDFLEVNPTLVEQSQMLSGMYFDALFRRGRWEDARKFADTAPELVGRSIEIALQLALYSCDWNQLGLLLEQAQANASLSAEDQLRFAQVATAFNRISIAKRLAIAAASASPRDPNILWGCYLVAMRGRWDNEVVVADWFRSAVDLSGPEGPVRQSSLSELIEMIPQQRKRSDELWSGIVNTRMFLALASQQVRKPLAALMLGQAEENRLARDPRFRAALSAFFGLPRPFTAPRPQVIALDQTALLTLAYLELLPRLLDVFPRIYLPYSTGPWLFNEQNEIHFHQPSRVYDAQRLLSAIARREIQVTAADGQFVSALASEIGKDLAQFVHAAQEDAQAGRAAYIIRPAPLHRPGSLSSQDANLGEYAPLFRSSIELLRSLKTLGAIDNPAYERGESYLKRNDRGWSHDSEIPPGATLYLDDVSVAYIQWLDLWSSLVRAGYRLFVHHDKQAEATALDQSDSTSQSVAKSIEAIREFVHDGQSRKIVRSLRRPNRERGLELESDDVPRFLLPQLLEHEDGLEAIVVDDRAANRHPVATDSQNKIVPCKSTLEVLDWLLDAGSIDTREWQHARTRLRQSGYQLIPVTCAELTAALDASVVRDGVLVESAAARAIRESHQLAQAAEIVLIPDEAPWLSNHGREISEAIVAIWEHSEEDAASAAKSTWLVELSRLDGFSSRLPGEWNESRFITLDAFTTLRFLMLSVPKSRHKPYNDWLEDRYLKEMKNDRPKVFDTLCENAIFHLRHIDSIIQEKEVDGVDCEAVTAALAKGMINILPASIRERILDDDDFLRGLGLSRTARVTVHIEGEPSFDTQALYDAVKRLYFQGKAVTIVDSDGRAWELGATERSAVVCSDPATGRNFTVRYAPLVSDDVQVREAYFAEMLGLVRLEPGDAADWAGRIHAGPINPLHFPRIDLDLKDTPRAFVERLRDSIEQGSTQRSLLIPMRRRYYERLVPPWRGYGSLKVFSQAIRSLPVATDLDQISLYLVCSSHPWLAPTGAVAGLLPSDLRKLAASLLPGIDLWSLTGLLEGIATRDDVFTDLQDLTKELLEHFIHLVVDQSDRLRLATAIVAAVDGQLNTSGLFTDTPVYWRRSASIAHAALIERTIAETSIPNEPFAVWAEQTLDQFRNATLADAWQAPRWSGFMLSAGQLKQELVGRVLNAFTPKRKEAEASNCNKLLFSDASGSLSSCRLSVFSDLPGPLEGSSEGVQTLPTEFLASLKESLEDTSLPLWERVLTAAHLAGLGRLPETHVELLKNAVSELDQSDLLPEDSGQLLSLLLPLSRTAASARDGEFATTVKNLLARHASIPLPLRLYGGLIACGSEAIEQDWAREVNQWIERLMSRDLSRDDARYILHVIWAMCDARPMLRRRLARAIVCLQGSAQRLG